MVNDTEGHYAPSSSTFQISKISSENVFCCSTNFQSSVQVHMLTEIQQPTLKFHNAIPYISEPLIYRLFNGPDHNKWVSLLDQGADMILSISLFFLSSSFSNLNHNPRLIS